MRIALALLLALSGVEGLVAPAAAAPVRKIPNIEKASPGQRKFLVVSTVAGAAALGYAGSREGAGLAVAGALGGAAIGFVAGGALIGIGAGLYYLWTGRRARPFT